MKIDKPISEMTDEYMQRVLNEIEQECIDNLDKYADCEDQVQVLRLRHEEAMEELVPEELRAEMRRQKALHQAEVGAVEAEKTELRGAINTATLALQHTVRGERKQAVWNKGRTTWDMPALNAYARTHPEVATLKKTGSPSVTVRKTGGK